MLCHYHRVACPVSCAQTRVLDETINRMLWLLHMLHHAAQQDLAERAGAVHSQPLLTWRGVTAAAPVSPAESTDCTLACTLSSRSSLAAAAAAAAAASFPAGLPLFAAFPASGFPVGALGFMGPAPLPPLPALPATCWCSGDCCTGCYDCRVYKVVVVGYRASMR